uniref:ATP synthase-coupling factor 6, mitochondrial n=1 Tax=Syphacia muris TaxID=451379 RepID=A0A0N5AG62_9BILA
MIFARPLPPGTPFRPHSPNRIFIPLSRAFERVFVYLYNRVISRTTLGLYDKRWNPRIHGPYCYWRYYGTPDTKLMDVKLNELSSWFGRRDKTPLAMWKEFHRNMCRVHYLYYSGPVYASVVSITFVFKS